MPFFKNKIVSLLLIGGALLVFMFYEVFFSASPQVNYLTTPVTVADIQDTVLASGSLQARRQVEVGAQVSGQLKSLKVVLGQEVKKGQLVAEIDSLAQQNALKNAKAALTQVQAQLRSKQATLVQARLSLTRQQTLLAGDADSRANYEAAEANFEGVLADIDSLHAQIEQARITMSTAMLNLSYTKIAAPMDGQVVAIVTKEGQTVNSAQLAPTIVILAELKTMTVKALVSEADVARVKPAQPAYFSILGDPDHRVTGILRSVELAPDSFKSGADSGRSTASPIYYNALFDVPNAGNKLRIAMTAQVSIVLNEARRALTIPSAALGPRSKDGRYPVQVLETRNGKPTVITRQVRIGINNVQAQVLEGLLEGERVILGSADDTSRSAPQAAAADHA